MRNKAGKKKYTIGTALAVSVALCACGCGSDYSEYSMVTTEHGNSGFWEQSSSGWTTEQSSTAYSTTEQSSTAYSTTEQQTTETGGGGESGGGQDEAGGETFYNQPDTPQLSAEDIQSLSGGNAMIVYSTENQVTSIVGRFYEPQISNPDDPAEVINSVYGVSSMLVLDADCEFMHVRTEKDDYGNTYQTYLQRMGGYTELYAALKVAVNADGYVCGLTNSFVSNLQVDADASQKITPDAAVAVVQQVYSTQNLNYYPQATVELTFPIANMMVDGYAVYTDNPDRNVSFDLPYIEHLVTYDGYYATSVAVDSLGQATTADTYHTDEYFENLTTVPITVTLTNYDGSTKTVNINVAQNSQDGLYYMADPERKIMFADYYAFEYEGYKLDFKTSATADGFDNDYMAAMYNYARVYDFYKERGITSVDGYGIPILILSDYVNQNKQPENNAVFMGINQGWATFCISKANYYSYCVDAIAHEYTHGVRGSQMVARALYAGEAGAIHEAFSDIMGNIIQDMLDGGEPSWLIAEESGTTLRCMAFPDHYLQPRCVGDKWYMPVTATPSAENDNGGVHINSSIPNLIAARLKYDGVPSEVQFELWWLALKFMSPRGDFDDLHAALVFAARALNMQSFEDSINESFEFLHITGNELTRDEEARNNVPELCAKVECQLSGNLEGASFSILFFNPETREITSMNAPYPDGLFSAAVTPGDYGIAIRMVSGEGSNKQMQQFFYDGSSWSQDSYMKVTLDLDEKLELPGITVN